jgi:hypothetical protein
MAEYLGDIVEDATIRGCFNTRTAAGAPITLAGTPSLEVYKDANTTQSTAGVTLTVDFDSRTGLHLFTIDTSADAFYVPGAGYRVCLAAGTVDGVSVVGVCVGQFSIENRNNKTNVTQISGDSVAADNAESFFDGTGYAGTGNVIPTVTTVNGLGANVITASAIETGAITSAKFAAGAIDASAISTDAIGSAQLAATAVTEFQTGLATAANLAIVAGYLDTEIAAIKAKTDTIPASPASTTNITAASGVTVSAIGANVITAASIASDAGTELATAFLDLTDGIETSITVRQAMRLIVAACAGKVSGAAGTTVNIRNLADTLDRISATVDADGNRTAVTRNLG